MNRANNLYNKIYLMFKYGIYLNKPVYMLKLAKNIIKSKIFRLLRCFGIKRFVPRGIDFAVTYACNFNCSHCYAHRLNMKGPARKLTVADYRRIAREAMKLGIAVFSFQGGEPALLKNLTEIISAFKPRQNHITITTNGSLLTEEMVELWAAAGVDTVYFSLDSGLAEEHDRFRNYPGSFAKIMRAIDWVIRSGMRVAINTTVSKDNLYSDGFKNILDFSNRHHIMLETIFARPLGNWGEHTELMLNEQDIAYYYKLRKNYPFVVRDLDNNYGAWGCPAVKEVLYITANGDVCGCPYNHVTLGNLHDESLKKIIERGLKISWYDHYHHECLTAMDQEFLKRYLPLVKRDSLVDAKHFQ